MPTEIYLCRKGQAIKQGRLVYSDDIDDKHAAKSDATERCERDNSLHKIAYYKVDANSGDFKVFYTHTNPDATDPPPEKPKPKLKRDDGAGGGGKPKKAKPKAKKKGPRVKQKLVAWLYD